MSTEHGGSVADGPESDLPRGIGRPATGAFAQVGLTKLEQFPAYSEKELLALHGVGPKAVRILKAELAERGLALRDD